MAIVRLAGVDGAFSPWKHRGTNADGCRGLARCGDRVILTDLGRWSAGALRAGETAIADVQESQVPVRLRLKRFGRRHRPCFRLTAMDGRQTRDGRAIEELGSYSPIATDPAKQFECNKERVEYWLSVGAQPSDTVRALLKKHGIAVPGGS